MSKIFFILMMLSSVSIAQEVEDKNFSLYLEGAIGLNTNPSMQNTELRQNSKSTRANNTSRTLNQYDSEGQLATSLAYKAIKTNSFTLHTQYDFWSEHFYKNSSENLLSNGLSLPLNYYTTNYHWEITPSLEHQIQDDTSHLTNSGVELKITKRFELLDLTLFTSFNNTNVLDDNYQYLAGIQTTHGLKITIPLTAGELSVSGAGKKSENEDSVTTISSYEGFNFGISYNYFTDKWLHSVGVEYERQDFKQNNYTNVKRQDDLRLLRYRPSYFLTNDTAIFVELKYSEGESNVITNNFKQYISIVGFSWSY